jgi:hypothetical protein
VAGVAKPVACSGGAAVLPDNGGADRFERLAVPQDEGFALVRDADSYDVGG